MTNPFDAATPHLIACYEDNYLHGFVKPHYPVPAIIGRVSLGTDYPGVWYIDSADQDNPVMLWSYDTWPVFTGANDPWYWR
jgi:hypothetical protein